MKIRFSAIHNFFNYIQFGKPKHHFLHPELLQVRIWNVKSVGKNMEDDDSNQRLLATLRDHFGSVNCVRWAKHGRYVASGSDDQTILVHEKKPGSGTTEFGSGEPPDIENWKVAMTLRGHTADVVMIYLLIFLCGISCI